jgi:hypothetical protein
VEFSAQTDGAPPIASGTYYESRALYVYSDNASIIASPGALGKGITSFTIDPDVVASETTVEDSVGATAIANVTVNP